MSWLDLEAQRAQAGGQTRLQHEAEVVHEHGRAALREVAEQQLALAGEVGCSGGFASSTTAQSAGIAVSVAGTIFRTS